MLSQITRYFATHRRACLADLVNHLDAEPDAVAGMLDILAAKGRIVCISTSTGCGGCTRCDPAQLMIYEWRGA